MPKILVCFGAVVLLLACGITLGQMAEHFRTLVINEQSGRVAVLEMGDRTYVDLKRLAEIAHGSMSSSGNRIVLDIVCTSPSAAAARTAESEQAAAMLLSRDFMKAGIEEIALMREWASPLANAIQNGYPVTESWVSNYRAKAQSGLAISSAAVSTDADRNAFQLLNREFENVEAWSNKLLESRRLMEAAKYATSPDALQKDPLSQQIVSCGRFLGQMLASGSFQDDAACH